MPKTITMYKAITAKLLLIAYFPQGGLLILYVKSIKKFLSFLYNYWKKIQFYIKAGN